MKTCTDLNCACKTSVCCNAHPVPVIGDEGTGHFECYACGKEFIAGKCTSGPKNKIVARIEKDNQGLWLVIDGLEDDTAWPITKEEILPIREAIDNWILNNR